MQHTREPAEPLRHNQARPVEIQGTFNPKYRTFRLNYITIAYWLQEIKERAALHTFMEPNNVTYAELAMPSQNGHLQDVKHTTIWAQFKQLKTYKFERRNAQHNLLQAIQDLCMHGHDFQQYVNEFTRLKALIAANVQ